ncbi:helix-turn-helix domain-containing protein [Nonomuraea sp. NPDC003707]
MLVLTAIDNGTHVDDAAAIFDVGRSTIFGWIKLREEGGPAARTVKMPPGPLPALNEQQLAQLRDWITGRDPRQLQFDFGLRTRAMVAELIKRKFGVEFTPQWVGKLLARLGLSPAKAPGPRLRAKPERVRRWKEQEYPKIRAQAISQGASIYFLNEASVRTNHHAGTTWGPIGDTPTVRGTPQTRAAAYRGLASRLGSWTWARPTVGGAWRFRWLAVRAPWSWTRTPRGFATRPYGSLSPEESCPPMRVG